MAPEARQPVLRQRPDGREDIEADSALGSFMAGCAKMQNGFRVRESSAPASITGTSFHLFLCWLDSDGRSDESSSREIRKVTRPDQRRVRGRSSERYCTASAM